MTAVGLSSGTEALREAGKKFFNDVYQNPPIAVGMALDPNVAWTPSLIIKINDHLTVVVEASETPYPIIISLRRVNIENLSVPVAIYCICPEEAYLADHAEAKRLINDGYGLLTVDANGDVQQRAGCIPVIQQISDVIFKEEIKPLPPKIKRRVAESYLRYQQSAPMGVADISEVLEGFVLKAGQEAANKKIIDKKESKTPASILTAMMKAPPCQNAAAAIGGAQGYISTYRNISHHFPKDRRQAAKKYRDCRHAFLDGLKKIEHFRSSMKLIGLSGNI